MFQNALSPLIPMTLQPHQLEVQALEKKIELLQTKLTQFTDSVVCWTGRLWLSGMLDGGVMCRKGKFIIYVKVVKETNTQFVFLKARVVNTIYYLMYSVIVVIDFPWDIIWNRSRLSTSVYIKENLGETNTYIRIGKKQRAIPPRHGLAVLELAQNNIALKGFSVWCYLNYCIHLYNILYDM